jgi:hypothetical protein
MLRFVVLFVFVAVAFGAGPVPHGPSYHPEPHYDESPKPYAYQYGVHDDYSGTNFNAQEQADGKVVTGSYQVGLKH